MSDRYCVFGNPVGHSKSPAIHAAFARQTGQDMAYQAILAPLGQFTETVQAFIKAGGRGANVTVPFKEEAFHLCTRRTPRAGLAGAVNTLSFNAGEILGDNTDGAGLIRDLTINLHSMISGRRVLLLGAGGAARGALGPLSRRGLPNYPSPTGPPSGQSNWPHIFPDWARSPAVPIQRLPAALLT